MSTDIVDDLHAAEDALASAGELGSYCRPSCAAEGVAGDCESDDDCGCPCHDRVDDRPVWTLDHEYARELLGRPLTDDEADRLAGCIPNSSIPEALQTIMSEALGLSADESEPDDDYQQCGSCGDKVHCLSSQGWCDGCEEAEDQARRAAP